MAARSARCIEIVNDTWSTDLRFQTEPKSRMFQTRFPGDLVQRQLDFAVRKLPRIDGLAVAELDLREL